MGEFYTIQIIGGGAGGGAHKGGGAGESKVVHYPGLDGTYVIKLGKGGTANHNGGSTIIYKKNYVKQDNGDPVTGYTLVEFAKGGTWTNEAAENEEDDAQGETPAFSETSAVDDADSADNICGRGGDANSSGKDGEVVIRW
jgi:hypothetical protein